MPGMTNTVGTSFDGLWVVDINSEHVIKLSPFWWDISNLDIVLNGMSEVVSSGSESLAFSGMLEGLKSSSNRCSLSVVKSSSPSSFVSTCPMSSIELLVLLANILKFISNILETTVVNMETVWCLINIFLKGLCDISPLSDKSLSLR